MKKQHISSEEHAWRQSATNHEFPLQEGDWSAMEQLIDQEKNRFTGGIAGGSGQSNALDSRWPYPFFAGVLISILVMAGQVWSGTEAASSPASPITTQQLLIADQASASSLDEVTSTGHHSSPSESVTIPSVQAEPLEGTSTSYSAKTSNSTIPPVPANSVSIHAAPASQSVPVITPAKPEATQILRPGVSDFNTLTEKDFTPGLMAFSRLTGKVGVGAPVITPELPTPPAYVLPPPVRWTFGLLAGARMALPDWPMETSSVGGVAGAFVQYDLTPRWSVRTEIAGKLLHRNLERTDSDVIYDGFGASNKVDQSAKTNELLFIEMPILAVLRKGRSEFFGGPKLALIRILNDATSLAVTGSAFTEINQYDIPDGVRQFDAGIVLGYGYQLYRYWGVDIRYNQGLLDLTHDNFFNNTHTLINSDLQLTIRYVF